jgi:hypothetical protein
MHIRKILTIVAFSAMTLTGLASAQAGGTPDALNGAKGRDRPTSYEGHRHGHSMRHFHYHHRHHFHHRHHHHMM